MRDYEGMIVIHGDLYQFTDSRDGIHQIGKDHILYFSDLEGHYAGRYDLDHKVFKYDSYDLTDYDKFWWPEFYIPPAIVDNIVLPENELKKYNDDSWKHNHGYYRIDKDLSARLNGALPVITWDGIEYEVDAINREIRQKAHPEKKFCFGEDRYLQKQMAYYNTSLKEPVPHSYTMDIIEGKIVVLEFPHLLDMDPLAYQRKFGADYTKERFHPWRAAEDKIQISTTLRKTRKPILRSKPKTVKPKIK